MGSIRRFFHIIAASLLSLFEVTVEKQIIILNMKLLAKKSSWFNIAFKPHRVFIFNGGPLWPSLGLYPQRIEDMPCWQSSSSSHQLSLKPWSILSYSTKGKITLSSPVRYATKLVLTSIWPHQTIHPSSWGVFGSNWHFPFQFQLTLVLFNTSKILTLG